MFGGEKIADAVYSGMKRLVKDRDWVDSLRSGFMGALDRIGQFLKGVVEGVKSGVKVVGEGVGKLGEKVLDVAKWVGESLGIVAREAEAGTIDMVKAAGVVGHVRGDPGGVSVGMYQFTKGSALKFLREYGYMKEFEGVEFGTPEWRKRWQEVAKRHGAAFAKAQQEFAVKEYFVPGVGAAERFGIDVKGSRALQEMVFARAIQHGVGGFERVLRNVFGGMAVEQVRALSSQEIITRVYDHLIANVDKYWASSSPKVRESVRKRLVRERELLLAMDKQKTEVKKQGVLQEGVAKEVSNLYGSVKEQVGLQMGVAGGLRDLQSSVMEQINLYRSMEEGLVGVGEGVKEVDLLGGGYMGYGDGKRMFIPLQMDGIGRVVDDGLVVEQQEVVRKVIEEGVRRETEWTSNLVSLMEGMKGRLSEVEGPRKTIMSGGDAFSKVPLFPEDMGLVMMMLGLV
jgi:hypothetical protein